MQVPLLLRFFDKAYVMRLFFLLLLLSIPMLADGYVLVVASSVYGVFMVLGVSAAIGLGGILLVLGAVDATLEHLRDRVREGRYPSREYCELAALIAGGVLIAIPGLVTDALAVVLYIPPFRRFAGMLLVRPLRSKLKDVYEYLKLEA